VKPAVLVTHPLYPSALEAIEARFDAVRLFEAGDADALLAELGGRINAIAGGHVGADLIGRLPNLEIIANFGVGYDSVDTAAAKARGIAVTNTPDVLNDAVAELALGLMLALARKIPQSDRFVRDGRWAENGYPLTGELNGKTLGILGLGRIGKEIATRAQAMKMRIIYHGRNRQDDQPFIYYDNLADMARDADWLMVIAPGGAGTKGIVSREVLEALGPDGAVVNLGRGTSIDEGTMLDLLENGKLGGAALDVFEDEPRADPRFFALENVVLSPHQGSATHQTRHKMGMAVLRNLEAHFAGEPLPNRVV
jgi:lactate dehydrogenase-like 2-hydroxyacid dehydrogenase